MKAKVKILAMVLIGCLIASSAIGDTITVDDDGPADFNNIQAAINYSNHGDTIIVAEGRYFENINFNGRNITLTSTDPCSPDVVAATIIDGNRNGSVVTFHIYGNANSVLNGFTITNGNAEYGGGIYCGWPPGPLVPPGPPTLPPGPMIKNCIIINNSAERGGGMYNYKSNPKLTNCMFTENSAERGGGMYNYWFCEAILTNCTFVNNLAERTGGGMSNIIFSDPKLTNCIFLGNCANTGGGMLIQCLSGPIVTNCTFTGNKADLGGGGIYSGDGCPPPYPTASLPVITNCILYGNTPDELYIDDQWTPVVAYSDVAGGWPGEGNIDADPCFVEPGYWEPPLPPPPPPPGMPLSISAASYTSYNSYYIWVEGDYHLHPISPCIDAGDPDYSAGPNEMDLDGKPRVLDGNGDAIAVVDIGAYESIPPIPAEIRINPSSINVESKGDWITCYIQLPDGFNVADIDTNSILLEYTIEPEEFWVNESKQVAMARFRHEEVQAILEIGEVELSIVGLLRDRTVFVGTDVIKVTDKGGRGPDKNLQASVPNVTDVSITASMSWTAGSYAKSHDVYFGTSNPPPFICNQTAITFDPGTMDYETTYYWRIDEVSKWGVTDGQLWSFTTIEAPTPPPPPPPGGGGGGKPPGAPPGCFPADTPVWIDGAQVQISKVAAGQKVGRLDATDAVSCFEKPVCLKEIESVLEYQGTYDYYNIVLETGNRINVVHSHYFLTASDRWVLVENLKVGSKLKSLKGPISIKTIAKREVPFTGRFYNLKIKGGDRYFVGKDGVAVRSN